MRKTWPRVKADGETIPHFHRRKFEDVTGGWYYSQSLSVLFLEIKYPNFKKIISDRIFGNKARPLGIVCKYWYISFLPSRLQREVVSLHRKDS